MSKTKTRKDPVFGEIVNVAGDLWQRSFEITFLGRVWKTNLMVQMDESGAEENQVSAYKVFQENLAGLVKKAEQAVLDYYHSDEFRDTYGSPEANIKTPRQLGALVELEGVIFPYVRPSPTFGFLCKCTWEPDQGLGIKFENDKVVEVGLQDIIL